MEWRYGGPVEGQLLREMIFYDFGTCTVPMGEHLKQFIFKWFIESCCRLT